MACVSCKAHEKWKTFNICIECIDNSLMMECTLCACGPYAPMEHMKKVKLHSCEKCESQVYCNESCEGDDSEYHAEFCDSLHEMQLMLVTQKMNEKHCSACNKKPPPEKKLQRCSACHVSKYCGIECQYADRFYHQVRCARIVSLYNELKSSAKERK